jgi:hypothetical protein
VTLFYVPSTHFLVSILHGLQLDIASSTGSGGLEQHDDRGGSKLK